MEADWARFYRRDLRADLFGPEPIGARRLRSLMLGLPPDAMLWRRTPGWGSAEELAAMQAELTHSVVRVLVAANSKKGARLPKPLHVPRPGDKRASSARRIQPSDLSRIGAAVARQPAKEVAPDGR